MTEFLVPRRGRPGPPTARTGAVVSSAPDVVQVPDGASETEGGLGAHIARAAPGVTVISLVGAVDVATVGAMADALAACGDRWIVLELNRVTFLAACGLGVIIAAHHAARRDGGGLALVADEVAPVATSLRFLAADQGPLVHRNLTAALAVSNRS